MRWQIATRGLQHYTGRDCGRIIESVRTRTGTKEWCVGAAYVAAQGHQ